MVTSYGCSNVAKLKKKKYIYIYDFLKSFFFSKKVIHLKQIFASPFKKFNSVKKIPSVKKIIF